MLLNGLVILVWKYINLNPRKKSVGDCTVRAIAIATGSAWVETYLDLCLLDMVMADMPSANSMGRYSRDGRGMRDGYSREDGKAYMMEQLEDMMEDAEKPAEKEALRRCMEALKRA